MDLLQLVVLAVVQGLTEFLPISSAAHLILVPEFTNWEDQGLAFDIAMHAGSLVAVMGYFRRDIAAMLESLLLQLRGKGLNRDARLAWQIALATIPVGLVGLGFKDVVETELRSPIVIGVASIVFGLLLGAADRWGRRQRDEHGLGWRDALFIGLFQAVALIPGTSRSGITMTAALLLGLGRTAAARFSFLLAIPVLVLSGGLQTVELLQTDDPVAWGDLGLATVLAALTTWACIHYFLRFIARIGMAPFVVYRVALGIVLLVVFAL